MDIYVCLAGLALHIKHKAWKNTLQPPKSLVFAYRIQWHPKFNSVSVSKDPIESGISSNETKSTESSKAPGNSRNPENLGNPGFSGDWNMIDSSNHKTSKHLRYTRN